MTDQREHPYLPRLRWQFANGRCDRREFLRTATLLGVSATGAYALAGRIAGSGLLPEAHAAMPRGGTLRIAMAVQELTTPHTYQWSQYNITRQVCQFLTRTGHDNITRPHLLESWSPSDELRSWTFRVRRDVKWHSGRPFLADDAIWNLRHLLDPATGSSAVGLMKSYLLEEVDKDGEKSTVLWDANAIEKVDEHTFRLNLRSPQIAIPEHLFHYTNYMLDPAEDGHFGPGSNGTGPFELVEAVIGEKAVLRARRDYWGEGPYLDELQFIDLGEEPGTAVAALQSDQVDALYQTDISQLEVISRIADVEIHEAATAATGVARGKVTHKPFDDPRVRRALKLAVDPQRVLDLAHHGKGLAGEHHHVLRVADDLVMAFYSSGHGVRAAFATRPEGPFVPDPDFLLLPQAGWERCACIEADASLEANGAYVALEEDEQRLLFWEGYDSYCPSELRGELGWVQLELDKRARRVHLHGRHPGNPLRFLPEGHLCARCGGNLASDVRIAGQPLYLCYTRRDRSHLRVLAALGGDPLFQQVNRISEFDHLLGDEEVVEKFQLYQRDDMLNLLYESRLKDGRWCTGFRRYRICE